MNEHDLQKRMAASTAWTAQEPMDPKADLTRGRSRLRRKRIAVSSTAAAAVAVAALGFNAITSAHVADVGVAARPIAQFPPADASDQLYALLRSVAPPPGASEGPGGITSDGDYWKQGGGVAYTTIFVGPGAHGEEVMIRNTCKPTRYPDSFPHTCQWTTTADGKRVLIGRGSEDIRQNGKTYKGVKSYVVLHRFSTGRWAMIRISGGLMEGNKKTPPPVVDPKVSIERMIDAVTDPRLAKR